MKKYLSRTIKLISALAVFGACAFFTSCDGVIFDTIRDEVKLEDAKVSGDILSIVRYKNDVYTSTGKIFTRSLEDADVKKEFSEFLAPGGYVFSLAADSKNLYALAVVYEKDDDGYNVATKRVLAVYNGSEWKTIWQRGYTEKTPAALFCTNAPKESNRHAYFRYGSTVYELDGSEITSETTGMTLGTTDYSTVPTASSISCTVLGSTVYFSSANAMTSNETAENDSTYIYYSKGDNVYYSTDGSKWASSDLGCDTIYSMALTKDYLLAGTSDGIVHTPLKADANKVYAIPSNGTSDFSTNADSTLSSYYRVESLMVVDSAMTETSATIFASAVTKSTSASLHNVGLWSYFASTGEWNRE